MYYIEYSNLNNVNNVNNDVTVNKYTNFIEEYENLNKTDTIYNKLVKLFSENYKN